jgi:hypothetical protein
MPSVGLKQKLGVAVLTAAIFVLSASAASAKQAWVWACHGPAGGAIGTQMTTGAEDNASAVANCAGADNEGATLSLTGDAPAGGSHATLEIQLPAGVTASRVRITHVAHGSSAGARYTVKLDGATVVDQELDTPVATLPADVPKNGSGTLTFSLTCDQAAPCGGPVSVDVVKVGVLVDDTSAPTGTAGGNTPITDAANISTNTHESGVGYSHVTAVIAADTSGGAIVRTKTIKIGSCDELTPGDATIDLPLDSTRCRTGPDLTSFQAEYDKDKPWLVKDLKTALDTKDIGAGFYYRRATVYDAAGNATDLFHTGAVPFELFEIWHPDPGKDTQTLSIGSSSTDVPTEQPNTNPNQNPTRNANAATSCRSPRLSVSLAQKPLRVSKSRAVLKYGKRYRFEGRLTCVVNGRRVSAPKRTKIQLLNKVGKKTVTKTGPRIGSKGRFKISLKYPKGSRSLIFRFTSAEKQRSQVTIKIKVEKVKKKKSSKR